ncbi:MAG: hypothetical protein ACTS2F_17850 [Thainema sp.]
MDARLELGLEKLKIGSLSQVCSGWGQLSVDAISAIALSLQPSTVLYSPTDLPLQTPRIQRIPQAITEQIKR